MKANRLVAALYALIAVAWFPQAAHAQSAEAVSVAPFTGESGYQEIRLAADSWYLAFHGTRKHAISSVQAAWLGRAGQLCESAGKPYVIELRYVGQPAFPEDPVASAEDFSVVRVAGPVYIPMFIPSGPQTITPALTPTKAAAIRCAASSSGLKAGLVAIPVSEAKEGARKVGLSKP